MKYLSLGILLLGGFFYSSHSLSAKVVLQDKMAFKLAKTVFSVNDLEQIHSNMKNLKCIYDDSLLVVIFKDQFKTSKISHYQSSKDFSAKTKKHFRDLIEFGKLYVYAGSQNVVVNKNIEKFFYLMGKRNKCDLQVFDNKKQFKSHFQKIVELEVFVRSRFLSSDNAAKTSRSDRNKAVLAAQNLLKSINKQIEEEVYW